MSKGKKKIPPSVRNASKEAKRIGRDFVAVSYSKIIIEDQWLLISLINDAIRRNRADVFEKTLNEAADICNHRAFMQKGLREAEALECQKEIRAMKRPK